MFFWYFGVSSLLPMRRLPVKYVTWTFMGDVIGRFLSMLQGLRVDTYTAAFIGNTFRRTECVNWAKFSIWFWPTHRTLATISRHAQMPSHRCLVSTWIWSKHLLTMALDYELSSTRLGGNRTFKTFQRLGLRRFCMFWQLWQLEMIGQQVFVAFCSGKCWWTLRYYWALTLFLWPFYPYGP